MSLFPDEEALERSITERDGAPSSSEIVLSLLGNERSGVEVDTDVESISGVSCSDMLA